VIFDDIRRIIFNFVGEECNALVHSLQCQDKLYTSTATGVIIVGTWTKYFFSRKKINSHNTKIYSIIRYILFTDIGPFNTRIKSLRATLPDEIFIGDFAS
jgi:hypothetical protein